MRVLEEKRTKTEVDRKSGSCRSFRSELFWLIFVKEVVSGKQDRQELSEHFGVGLLVFSSAAINI